MEVEGRRWNKMVEIPLKLVPLLALDIGLTFSNSLSTVDTTTVLQALGFLLTIIILLQKTQYLVSFYRFMGYVVLLLLSYTLNAVFDVNHPLNHFETVTLLLEWEHPLKYYGFSILQMFIAVIYTISMVPRVSTAGNILTLSSFFFPILISLHQKPYSFGFIVSISDLVLLHHLMILAFKMFPYFLGWCNHFKECIEALTIVWRILGFQIVAVIFSKATKLKVLLHCLFWVRTSVILAIQVYMFVRLNKELHCRSILEFLKDFVLHSTFTTTSLMAVSCILAEVSLLFITLFGKIFPFPIFPRVLANDFGFLFCILSLHYDTPSFPPQRKLEFLYVTFCQCILNFIVDLYDRMDMQVLTLDPPQNNPPKWRVLLGYATLQAVSIFLLLVLLPYCYTNPFLYSAFACFLTIIIKIPLSAVGFCTAQQFERAVLVTAGIDYFVTFLANITMLCYAVNAYVLDKTKVFKAFRVMITSYRLTASYVEDWLMYLRARDGRQIMINLREATQQQLENLRDICAICREALLEARVTPCGHYFHFSCLNTWVTVGYATCPLCHSSL